MWINSRSKTLYNLIRRRLHISGLFLIGVLSRPAAAQSEESGCEEVPAQFEAIAELLTRIEQLGVALGLSLAAVMYIWAGINWMRGTADGQQHAKRVFRDTSIGLVIILLASGLVEFLKSVLGCGGA